MLQENSVVVRSEELIESDIDGETVILSIANGKYYGLNATSSEIWALLQTPHSPQSLCSLLLDRYDVTQQHCLNDLLPFLHMLLQENLIKQHEAD